MKYANIITAVYGSCWAIMPEKLAAIVALLNDKQVGIDYSAEEIERRIGAKRGTVPRVAGDVAVINIFGTIAQRMSMMDESSGGTSAEAVGRIFDSAVADPKVGGIILNFDTPGGSVAGIETLSDKIFNARGSKPIVAVANSLAASAGYWLASAADSIVADPGAEVGSVGVVAMHVDQSAYNQKLGVQPTFIHAGPYKVEGNPHQPLGDEAHAAIQARVDEYYGQFVGALARNRNVSRKAVREDFGGGRVMGASEALAAGMIDRIAPFDTVVAEMVGGKRSRGMRAEGYPSQTARAAHEMVQVQ